MKILSLIIFVKYTNMSMIVYHKHNTELQYTFLYEKALVKYIYVRYTIKPQA